MKTYKLKKNNSKLFVSNFVVVKGSTVYPVSIKTDKYLLEKYPELPSEGIVLTENEIKLMTIPRRLHPGDNVHISRVPLSDLKDVLNCSKDLKGEVISTNGNRVNVRLTNPGLCAKTLTLRRSDVTLLDYSNLHKVAYFICNECGMVL